MSVIRWETPAATKAGRRPGFKPDKPDPRQEQADALRARPNEWAVIFEGVDAASGGLATTVRDGRTPAWRPPQSFEACTRKVGTTTAVYARYVGEQP